MRSIGKVNIKKLNKIILEEYKKEFDPENMMFSNRDCFSCIERIRARVPDAWFDIWESAWSEIERLIQDGFNKLYYKK